MGARQFESIISDTSPASATTAVGDTIADNLLDAESLTIIATLQGGTGGTLDVYLQTSFDDGETWWDFAHFPQLADGAAVSTRVWHVARATNATTLTAIGTDETPALAVNTILPVWGSQVRALYVAGASTSAGAAQVIRLIQWSPRGG
jgi:hypothetical protein